MTDFEPPDLPILSLASSSSQTIASQLYERVRSDIIRGDLRPGQKLKIVELCSRYEVGAIPLREALSRLATTGFVESRDQRGFAVREVSASELADVTKVRLLIEPTALRESIQNGGEEWAIQLTAAHDALSQFPVYSDDIARKLNPTWEAAHDHFHKLLLSACQSPWLIRLTDELRDQTTRYRHISAGSVQTPNRDVKAEHRNILEAAIQRRVELAVVLSCEHISRTTAIGVGEMPKDVNTRGRKRSSTDAE